MFGELLGVFEDGVDGSGVAVLRVGASVSFVSFVSFSLSRWIANELELTSGSAVAAKVVKGAAGSVLLLLLLLLLLLAILDGFKVVNI